MSSADKIKVGILALALLGAWTIYTSEIKPIIDDARATMQVIQDGKKNADAAFKTIVDIPAKVEAWLKSHRIPFLDANGKRHQFGEPEPVADCAPMERKP